MEQIENQTDFYRWKHGLLFNQSEIELFASSGSSPEEKEFRAGFLVGLYKQGISYKDMIGDSEMQSEISLADAFNCIAEIKLKNDELEHKYKTALFELNELKTTNSQLQEALKKLQNEKCHLCRFNTIGQDEYIHALEDQEKEKEEIIREAEKIIKTLCKYSAFHEENNLVVLEVTKTDLAKAEAFLSEE